MISCYFSFSLCFCFFNHFLIVILLQLSQSFPLCSPLPIPPPAPTVNSHTIVHVCGSLIHVLCLVPSPSFHHYPPPCSPLVTFSLFHVPMPVVLFCSLVYFVHYIPLLGEIIFYLSFTNWLISLSIIFSNSIHTIGKGRGSFFLSAA